MSPSSVKEAAKLVLNRRVRVKYGYNLTTSMIDKYNDASDFDGWTVFLNKAETLAHVLKGGCDWMMIRLPGLRLKGTSRHYVVKFMCDKLYEGLS